MSSRAIYLPSQIHAQAKELATLRGFAELSDYLADLIRRDIVTAAKAPPVPSRSIRRRPEPLSKIRKRILDGMYSYMKASEDPGYGYACGYLIKHIDRCAEITRDFLERLADLPKGKPSRVLEEVKRVVLRLNRLNESCGGALIETDQREDLCQLILLAAHKAGLKSDRDVTEQWREW